MQYTNLAILNLELTLLIALACLVVFGIRRRSTAYGESVAIGAGILLTLASPLVFYDMTVGHFYREMASRQYSEEESEALMKRLASYADEPADATLPENVEDAVIVY